MNFLKQKDSLTGETYELEHVLFLEKKNRKKGCAKISAFFAIYTILFLLNRFKTFPLKGSRISAFTTNKKQKNTNDCIE